MTFDFDHPPDRRHSGSIKWDRYAGRDVLPMWVADMDFAAPPAVVEALRQRVDHGIFGYGGGPPELKPAIVAWCRRRYGWEIQPDWIVYVPGVMIGMSAALRALTQPGDAVVTSVPIYPPFLRLPPHLGRKRVDVPLAEPGQASPRWELDLAALGQALPGSRALMWCNPHNPCGRIFGRDEQRAVAELCLEHGAIICADEIHCDLLLEDGAGHVPMATLSPEIGARTLTFMAPSKTFNIPGLSFSFAVVSDEGLRRQLRQAMTEIVPWPNILGYVAAQAAYQQGEPWLEALLDYLRGNRDLLESAVGELAAGGAAIGTSHVEATYLAWLDVRKLGLEEPQRHFERHGLGLMNGADFGQPGFVRLNFGCTRDLLRQALERLARAVQAARSSGG